MVGFHTEECDKKGSHRQESLGGAVLSRRIGRRQAGMAAGEGGWQRDQHDWVPGRDCVVCTTWNFGRSMRRAEGLPEQLRGHGGEDVSQCKDSGHRMCS